MLTDYLGGSEVAGDQMKSTAGWFENGNASNSSGFSGLPGGDRGSNGDFFSVGYYGYWWSSSEFGIYDAWFRFLNYFVGFANQSTSTKQYGFSVRCLRD